MKPLVIAGNWKMHAGPSRTREFFADFRPELHDGVRVVIFPPAVSLVTAAASSDRDPRIALGVQNIHFEDQGAFTGETSAPMARDAGATYALIGHSERRHVFGETDDQVRRKVEAALRSGLVPVICVGETQAQRRAGKVEAVILPQLDAALAGLGKDAVDFLVAYEPVWAIGTGETATPKDAQTAQAALRANLVDRIGAPRAAAAPILYGGSVKPDNAATLLAQPDVDGLLVGGASLEAGSFAKIVAAAVRAS